MHPPQRRSRYYRSINNVMITAFVLHAECNMLWSEVMHDDMVILDRLPIANPFRRS